MTAAAMTVGGTTTEVTTAAAMTMDGTRTVVEVAQYNGNTVAMAVAGGAHGTPTSLAVTAWSAVTPFAKVSSTNPRGISLFTMLLICTLSIADWMLPQDK